MQGPNFKFVLRKKRKRTVVTEIFKGDRYTHAQAIDHVFGGWFHYHKAKRWLKKNAYTWEEM